MTATRRAIVAGLAAFLAGAGLPGRGEPQTKEPRLTLRVGKASWTYTEEQLRAMATDTLPNLKGTKKKPAIPLEVLLFRDTKVAPDRVEMVFLIGDKITVLRDSDLKYFDKLVLATGEPKGGKLHKWSLAPEDEATHKAVSAHMGSRRKGGIYRIDIVLKGEQQ